LFIINRDSFIKWVFAVEELRYRILDRIDRIFRIFLLGVGIGSIERVGFAGLVLAILSTLLGWHVWAYLTYFIGTKLLPEAQTHSDLGELLRTIGFSSAPGMIRVLGIIPGLAWITYTVGSIWMLVAMVVAVREALDYKSTLRAVGVCLIGWLIQALLALGASAAAKSHKLPDPDGEAFWRYICQMNPYEKWEHWPGYDEICPGKSPHGPT
jgi:hypothetical protein